MTGSVWDWYNWLYGALGYYLQIALLQKSTVKKELYYLSSVLLSLRFDISTVGIRKYSKVDKLGK